MSRRAATFAVVVLALVAGVFSVLASAAHAAPRVPSSQALALLLTDHVTRAAPGPAAAGAPFALATSARSHVLQEFDGGPGQIALHGIGGLPGAFGTAASHGCVRLSTRAITWLAHRIGAGVPVRIVA